MELSLGRFSLDKTYQTMRTIRIVLLLLWVSAAAVAQDTTPNFQARYANAKSLLADGQFEMAMVGFREVAQAEHPDNIYIAYADFFYGVAAWMGGQEDVAQGIWKGLSSKYPDWKGQKEVPFWVGAAAFANGKFQEGYRVLESMPRGPQKEALEIVKSYYLLQETDVEVLETLFQVQSTDRELAVHLANTIANQPVILQNQDLLDFIIMDFDLDPATYNRITRDQSVKKEVYRVAIMLPFLQEILAKRSPSQYPDFYMGLLKMYEGMRMAKEHLDSLGMPIELIAYDTKRDSATTANLLAQPEMRSVDLIIGPLFPKPVELVREFSERNRIVMFNPMSTNAEALGNNPFAFLISASTETRARRVANYMAAHDPDSVAYIFYGTRPQDSTYAYAYAGELLSRGFDVPVILRIDEEKSQAGFEFLTQTVSYSTLVERDSARAAEAYAEYLEKKRRNSSLRLEKEEYFDIPHDSIGHILVASDNGLIAASMVGAIETRAAKGDSIGLMGSEAWLLQDYDYVTYEQLERLGILLTAPTYFEKNTMEAEVFLEKYIRRQNILPTREVYTGYDMLLFLGTMLHRHGTYFQFGMRDAGVVPGTFYQGFDYRVGNDNQMVPLLRFRNYRFEVVDNQ